MDQMLNSSDFSKELDVKKQVIEKTTSKAKRSAFVEAFTRKPKEQQGDAQKIIDESDKEIYFELPKQQIVVKSSQAKNITDDLLLMGVEFAVRHKK